MKFIYRESTAQLYKNICKGLYKEEAKKKPMICSCYLCHNKCFSSTEPSDFISCQKEQPNHELA
jgi:hypothetical protein